MGPEHHEWLPVTLDTNSRYSLAKAVETHSTSANGYREHLLKVLRSSRNDLLMNRQQGELVLQALKAEPQMSSLKARLEAFLGLRG